MFGALWHRSPRPIQWLLSRVADVVCQELDRYTSKQTINTLQIAGEVIGLTEMLDILKVLDEPDLPREIRQSILDFTAREWREVLSMAGMTETTIELCLRQNPEFNHLRRTVQQ